MDIEMSLTYNVFSIYFIGDTAQPCRRRGSPPLGNALLEKEDTGKI
jgi:hypothetical protein